MYVHADQAACADFGELGSTELAEVSRVAEGGTTGAERRISRRAADTSLAERSGAPLRCASGLEGETRIAPHASLPNEPTTRGGLAGPSPVPWRACPAVRP